MPRNLPQPDNNIREFKKPLGRHRRQRRLNLYFAYESRDTLKSFTLFITAQAITKLNLGNRDKLEINFKKSVDVVHVLQTTHNLVISRCCFAEDSKEMYKDL